MTAAAIVLGIVAGLIVWAWRAGVKDAKSSQSEAAIRAFNEAVDALHDVRDDPDERERLRRKYARK